MRRILILLLLAGAGILVWLYVARPKQNTPRTRQQAIAVSTHSDSFNTAVNEIMANYSKLAEHFVNWDSVQSAATATSLVQQFERIGITELQKDSSGIFETATTFIQNAKEDARTIASEKNIRQQREAFNSLTDNYYQFLNTVKYDRHTLYLQECPMAFDDTKAAFWLSEKEEIRNPYLGLHHPTYGKGMLSCGENKVKLDNTGATK